MPEKNAQTPEKKAQMPEKNAQTPELKAQMPEKEAQTPELETQTLAKEAEQSVKVSVQEPQMGRSRSITLLSQGGEDYRSSAGTYVFA